MPARDAKEGGPPRRGRGRESERVPATYTHPAPTPEHVFHSNSDLRRSFVVLCAVSTKVAPFATYFSEFGRCVNVLLLVGSLGRSFKPRSRKTSDSTPKTRSRASSKTATATTTATAAPRMAHARTASGHKIPNLEHAPSTRALIERRRYGGDHSLGRKSGMVMVGGMVVEASGAVLPRDLAKDIEEVDMSNNSFWGKLKKK